MTGNYTVNGQKVSLTQSDFIASGGEGFVAKKGHDAYKIYHDASKMIPAGKIHELSVLSPLTNVLGPQAAVYKDNNPVGFAMRYVKDTEFLCKLFAQGFRSRNNINEKTINHLVKIIQDTVDEIHKRKILLVDANEMNFLVSGKYDNVYFIDVDSYQTPSYPATALMESVRDRKVKGKQFTELSDWFSVGCVMFQLYIGCHPYKGRHPDYSPKDWSTMMDKDISVFNKKCALPPATQELNIIPKGHLRWFEAIFEKGDRLPPPQPDQMAPSGPVKAKIITSNDKFKIEVIYAPDMSRIATARHIDGICYIVTQKGIWANGRLINSLNPTSDYMGARTVRDVVPVQGDMPILAEWNKILGTLSYKTFDDKPIGSIESNGFFVSNRCLYTVVRDSLIEISFIKGSKIVATQQSVANIFHNHKVFDGIVIQNILNTCRFAIPSQPGKCQNIRVKELDKTRIIDAKYESGVCIVIVERNGKYERHTFIFDKTFASYSSRVELDVNLQEVTFTVKDNGVCVAENDGKLEIFVDNAKVKTVDSPLNGGETILSYKNEVYLITDTSLNRIASK